MKANILSNKLFNKFIRLLQEGFAGELTFANNEEASAFALNAHQDLLEELEDNLLNLHSKEQTLYLEGQFLKLERFGELIPRDNDEIINSLTKNGLAFLIEALGGYEPVELLADRLEPELVEELRVYRIRNRFLHSNSSDGFAALTGPDLQTYQTVFSSQLLLLAWHTLTSLYTLRGGIESAVPRKRKWKIKLKTKILNDLRSYVPEMREMTVQSHPTEEHIYTEWARYLTSLRWWNYPQSDSWLAPIEFEQAFHDAPDRQAFLAGFRRLLDAIEPILTLPDEENPLFTEDNYALSEMSRIEARKKSLHRARVNAKHIGQWLQLRQQAAAKQLMESLERIALVPECNQSGEPINVLTVADYYHEGEVTLRFEMLLSRLQNDMPAAQPELNLLHDRLVRLISYRTTETSQVDFEFGHGSPKLADLVLLIPHFTLVDRTLDVTTQSMAKVADDFCARLLVTINHRLPWAQRASDLVKAALGAVQMPSEPKPAGRLSHRAIALLHVYRDQMIEHGEPARQIAASYGWVSKTSGTALYGMFISLYNTSDRVNVDGKTGKTMIKAMSEIIPLLNPSQKKQVESEIDTLKARK
ncbi:hypothetical protein E5K00_16420 [Hymenobacter aquaticus]|uniref:Uncharacterized protein n=1 Tax=Hymenobacter aquaticus TaxID=1867101 RepID=A0A4Z0PVQ6_9BACT|nr:hypothetical protein [Hymenobacter aquaticus]TGE21850.1 hypothetical protein E5K00_16420 [Hymenobacter aquaticus]